MQINELTRDTSDVHFLDTVHVALQIIKFSLTFNFDQHKTIMVMMV